MPSIAIHCHELRIRDQDKNWRIIYRIDDDAVVLVEVFNKTKRATPKAVIEICQKRLARYDREQQE
jgi:phage-related protein